MGVRKTVAAVFALSLLWCCGSAQAYDVELLGKTIRIHGSVSQGFLKSTDNDGVAVEYEKGTAEYNDLLLNFQTKLTPRLRVGFQLVSRDYGEYGNNKLKLDWGFFDYAWKPWLGFRLGRIKQPLGLYGETWDLDIARTTLFLQPFGPSNRDIYTNIDGVGIYGSTSLGRAGDLSYEAVYGTTYFEKDSSVVLTMRTAPVWRHRGAGFNVRYGYGGKLVWQTPLEGLQLSASYMNLRDLSLNMEGRFWVLGIPAVAYPRALYHYAPGSNLVVETPSWETWLFSAEYTWNNLTLSAELYRTDYSYTVEPNTGELVTPTNQGRWYAQASYRWTDWFESALGYAEGYDDWHDPNPTIANYRKDWYAALRFDITDYWLVKLEAHHIQGARESRTDNFNGKPDPNFFWYGFKTTLYF